MKHREDLAMTKIERVEQTLKHLNADLERHNSALEEWKNNPSLANSSFRTEKIETLTETIEETKLEIEMYSDLLKVYKGQ